MRRRLPYAALLAAVSACSDAGSQSSIDACAGVPPIAVAVGRQVVIDPGTTGGCVVLAAAPDASTEYLLVAVSTAGQQVPSGIQGPYSWRGGDGESISAAGASSSSHGRPLREEPNRAARFHAALRLREHHAATRGPTAVSRAQLRVVPPPLPGASRAFQVCGDITCTRFEQVHATARFVGRRVAIFVDDSVPAGGLDAADIADLGDLFDDHLYPIDTTAFGRESDLDADGVVSVLLSHAVNALSGDCADGSVVLGYFLGTDLLPSEPGSNAGEVFYSRVPSPSAPACRHDRASVLKFLAPTFIHEFQHMISFNQHVLLRGGSAEAVWLNEGLSHFAEELGARLIPNGAAQGSASSRESQFLTPDLTNALDYLFAPEESFLVVPGGSLGTPAERGAGWLFVRWLADQFGGGDVRGTTLTRALLATSDVGAVNVAARTGVPFDQLVPAWQLANYLDDLGGFVPADLRLRYASINLRASLASLWPAFPLDPDSVGATGYRRDGVLRAGSGRHLRVALAAGGPSAGFQLAGSSGGVPAPLLAARIGVARVR